MRKLRRNQRKIRNPQRCFRFLCQNHAVRSEVLVLARLSNPAFREEGRVLLLPRHPCCEMLLPKK
jgi:hypothetical protein